MQPLKAKEVHVVDVSILKLVPVRKRKVSKKNYERLLANLQAVGLIEPLCVYQDGDQFFILDGYIRYTALLELGIDTVPCLVLSSRDLYTPNRQVSHLSPQQEIQMLRNALEVVDEESLAQAFGMESVRARLNPRFHRELHPNVVAELSAGRLRQSAAKELAHVRPERQLEILDMMQEGGDSSLAFVKAQILATPAAMRNREKRATTPWQKAHAKKRDLAQKLTEVEKHYDFYSTLYRQYVSDLLKLAIYLRQIINRPELRYHLAAHHAEDLAMLESVLAESEGRATA